MSDQSDEFDAATWAEYAEADFQVANSILRMKKKFPSISCFHAQQAAEKYLKAMLVAKGRDFPKIHNLGRLYDLCAAEDIFIGLDTKKLDDLNLCAVLARYPGTAPTIEEARDARNTAKVIRKFARKFLGLK